MPSDNAAKFCGDKIAETLNFNERRPNIYRHCDGRRSDRQWGVIRIDADLPEKVGKRSSEYGALYAPDAPVDKPSLSERRLFW